jgi:RimJ/RimL family protein N-acetyltransferase
LSLAEPHPAIILRPARPDDAEAMARWFVDLTELASWGGPDIRFPLSADQLAGWIAEGAAERPRLCLSAVDAGDRPIGHIQFLRDPPRLWARLGRFGIAPLLRGRGFGAALFDAGLRMAFEDLAVEELALMVVPENARARRLYDSRGFRDDGAASGRWVVAGKPYIMDRMVLTRPEWLRRISTAPMAKRG